MRRSWLKVMGVVLVASWLGLPVQAQNTLPANKVFRFVPHANLAVLDPI